MSIEKEMLMGLERKDAITWHTHAQRKPKNFEYSDGLERSILVGEVLDRIHENITPAKQRKIQKTHKIDQGR